MTSDLELAEEAARLAARVASGFARGLTTSRAKTGAHDLVSDADEAAEKAVRELLTRERPDDGLLGEEGTVKTGRRRWVIDPIDGTGNFLRGDPFWCSAVALEEAGTPLVSAVHHAEQVETFSAARGRGAYADGIRMHVATTALEDSVLATYWNPKDSTRSVMRRVIAATATTRVRGSGTLELAWLAAGRLDVWLQRDPPAWDWLPGALLVTESGGTADVVAADGDRWHVACAAHNRRAVVGLVAAGSGYGVDRSPDTDPIPP